MSPTEASALPLEARPTAAVVSKTTQGRQTTMSYPLTGQSAPPSLATLPSEVRDLIWDHLLVSVVDTLKRKGRSTHLLMHHECGGIFKHVGRFPATMCVDVRCVIRHSQASRIAVSSATGKEEALTICGGYNWGFRNPILAYELINKEIRGEIQLAWLRLYPNGRHVRAICCCEKIAQAIEEKYAIIKATVGEFA